MHLKRFFVSRQEIASISRSTGRSYPEAGFLMLPLQNAIDQGLARIEVRRRFILTIKGGPRRAEKSRKGKAGLDQEQGQEGKKQGRSTAEVRTGHE